MISGKHVPVEYQRGMAPASRGLDFDFSTRRPGNGLTSGDHYHKVMTHRRERRAVPREIERQLENA